MYSRLLARDIFSCRPSVIGIGVPGVSELVLMMVNQPQWESGHAVLGGMGGGVTGVPAT